MVFFQFLHQPLRSEHENESSGKKIKNDALLHHLDDLLDSYILTGRLSLESRLDSKT